MRQRYMRQEYIKLSLIRLHQELMNLFNLFHQQHHRNAVRQMQSRIVKKQRAKC